MHDLDSETNFVFVENKNMVCYSICNYRYRFMEYF